MVRTLTVNTANTSTDFSREPCDRKTWISTSLENSNDTAAHVHRSELGSVSLQVVKRNGGGGGTDAVRCYRITLPHKARVCFPLFPESTVLWLHVYSAESEPLFKQTTAGGRQVLRRTQTEAQFSEVLEAERCQIHGLHGSVQTTSVWTSIAFLFWRQRDRLNLLSCRMWHNSVECSKCKHMITRSEVVSDQPVCSRFHKCVTSWTWRRVHREVSWFSAAVHGPDRGNETAVPTATLIVFTRLFICKGFSDEYDSETTAKRHRRICPERRINTNDSLSFLP